MSIVENNSSKVALINNTSFIGKSFKFEPKYNSVQISCLYGGTTGRLTIFHSNDGITYDDYGDVFNLITNDVFQEVSLKGIYFYIKWDNLSGVNYTSFNLLTKIKEQGLMNAGEVTVNSVLIKGMDGTTERAVVVNSAGKLDVVASVNTITGFATETTLGSIETALNSVITDDRVETTSYLYSGSGDAITATSISSTQTALDTASVLSKVNAATGFLVPLETEGNILKTHISNNITIAAMPDIDASTNSILLYASNVDDASGIAVQADSTGKLNVNADCSGTVGVSTAGFKIYDQDGAGFSSTANVETEKVGLDVAIINNPNFLMTGSNYVTPTPTYSPVFVDPDTGALDVNVLNKDGVHENINIGFENNVASYCAGTTAIGNWTPINPVALEDDGWFYNNSSYTFNGILNIYDNQYGTQSNITWGDLSIWYIIFRNYNVLLNPSLYIVTNASTVQYNIAPNQFLAYGVSYMGYHGSQINQLRFNDPECPRILFNKVSAGNPSSSEIIKKVYLSFPSSSSPSNIYYYLVVEGALYITSTKTLINYYFTSDRKGLSEVALNKLTYTGDSLNVNIGSVAGDLPVQISTTNNSVKITDGTNTLDVLTTTGLSGQNIGDKNSICTNSCVYGMDRVSAGITPITSTEVPSIEANALDVFIANTTDIIVNVNNQSTQGYGVLTGINVMPIFPKKKSYVWSGYTLQANGVFGFNGTAMIYNNGSTNFGYTNYNVYLTCSAAKVIKVDYVNTSGDLVENISITLPANTATLIGGGQIKAVNRFKEITTSNYNAETCFLTYGSTSTNNVIGAFTTQSYFNGVIVIPNGFIGKISSFYFYANTASTFNIYKGSPEFGLPKQCIFQGNGFSNSVVFCPEDGLGGLLYPGEAIFVTRQGTATDSFFFGNVILTPY